MTAQTLGAHRNKCEMSQFRTTRDLSALPAGKRGLLRLPAPLMQYSRCSPSVCARRRVHWPKSASEEKRSSTCETRQTDGRDDLPGQAAKRGAAARSKAREEMQQAKQKTFVLLRLAQNSSWLQHPSAFTCRPRVRRTHAMRGVAGEPIAAPLPAASLTEASPVLQQSCFAAFTCRFAGIAALSIHHPGWRASHGSGRHPGLAECSPLQSCPSAPSLSTAAAAAHSWLFALFFCFLPFVFSYLSSLACCVYRSIGSSSPALRIFSPLFKSTLNIAPLTCNLHLQHKANSLNSLSQHRNACSPSQRRRGQPCPVRFPPGMHAMDINSLAIAESIQHRH